MTKGECPAPSNNRNLWLREGKPRQKNHGPPGWGLGEGLITPPRKTNLIRETRISMNTGYNGCSTTTCRTPDDAFISWADGAMTIMGESRKGAHTPNTSLADPTSKVKVGCWNVRTMFSVGKTAQITAEMARYDIGILGISECRWSGFGRLKTQTGETIIYSGLVGLVGWIGWLQNA